MNDKIKKAKSKLAEQKQEHEHNRLTFLTNKVTFYHAHKMFWRQARSMNLMTSRHNYWYMLIWQWLIKIIILISIGLFGGVGAISSMAPDGNHTGMILLGLMFLMTILGGIYVLFTFIPMLTMTMRRYKDIGLNRFWGLLVYTLIGIFVLVYLFAGGGTTTQTITTALLAIFAPGNLILCSLPQGAFVPKMHKKD